jgi:Ca2+-binding RTX toxin-like protein
MIYTSVGSNGIPNIYSVTEDRLVSIENVTGSNLADTITGNSQDNELSGGFGQDTLRGMGGEDILDGGAGRDTLTGGTQADTFRFSHVGVGADADRITDFVSGQDMIDFSPFYSQAFAFHNSNNNSNPPPEFIGSQAFTGSGNELRMFTNTAGETVIQINLYEDFDGGVGFGANDIEIVVVGTVSVNDFLF